VQPPCKEAALQCSPCKDDVQGLIQMTVGHFADQQGGAAVFTDGVADGLGETRMKAFIFVLQVMWCRHWTQEFMSVTIRLQDCNIYRMPPREEASYRCHHRDVGLLSRRHPL